MSDEADDSVDDVQLTKPKKQRTEAQIAATARMRKALEEKADTKKGLTADEKKLRLKAIREQLNGPLKKDIPAAKAVIMEEDDETESVEEVVPVVKPKKKEVQIVSKSKPKREPKIIYETESESEEEVIVVKKKKKPKKKTIIYEDATDEDEEEPIPIKPIRKERDTKTQQNASSKFKVTASDKPKVPTSIYYFAD